MLAILDPDATRTRVLAALAGQDGSVVGAAAVLGVSRMALYRLVERLDLRAEVVRRWPERHGARGTEAPKYAKRQGKARG